MWAEYLRVSGTSLEVLGIGEVYVSGHSGVVRIIVAKWYKTTGGSSHVFFGSSSFCVRAGHSRVLYFRQNSGRPPRVGLPVLSCLVPSCPVLSRPVLSRLVLV